MNNEDWSAYVSAAATLHGLALDASRQAEVVAQLQRIHEMASPMLAFTLAPDIEPAPVFRP